LGPGHVFGLSLKSQVFGFGEIKMIENGETCTLNMDKSRGEERERKVFSVKIKKFRTR
jgi:hypothetical protein